MDGTLKVFCTATGRLLQSLPAKLRSNEHDHVMDLKLFPDGTLVVASELKKHVWKWDAADATFRLRAVLDNDNNCEQVDVFSCLCLHPDGKTFVDILGVGAVGVWTR